VWFAVVHTDHHTGIPAPLYFVPLCERRVRFVSLQVATRSLVVFSVSCLRVLRRMLVIYRMLGFWWYHMLGFRQSRESWSRFVANHRMRLSPDLHVDIGVIWREHHMLYFCKVTRNLLLVWAQRLWNTILSIIERVINALSIELVDPISNQQNLLK